MPTLTKDNPRPYELGDINELPMAANTLIYEGAAVGDNGSGFSRPLVAGDPFRGFAESTVSNNPGTAGANRIRVKTEGFVQLPIGSLAITDVGKPVYASDDDTFTLTAGSNTHIGRVMRFVSSGVGIVGFEVDNGGIGSLLELFDSTGGTPGNTLVAIATGTPADLAAQAAINSAIRNNLSSLLTRLNALIKQFA